MKKSNPPKVAKAKPGQPNAGSALKLLGRSAAFPEQPSRATLDCFPNRTPGRDYLVRFDCAEFTSMCPVTGQPDFATIRIEYVPDALCIETKSLKFYLASYRHERSFNEAIINRILEDLVAVCAPRSMCVTGTFSPRGGIQVTVKASHPE